MEEDFLLRKLEERKQQNAFRQLLLPDGKVDFCSNDYLGMVKNRITEQKLLIKTPEDITFKSGSTGSRLLTGNYALIEEVEIEIANFHDAARGLIFNSGYDANIGLLSCVPQQGDTLLYDYLSHASIRDGIRLSLAQSFSFQHNDLNDLENKLKTAAGNIYVITESVFSMDGDKAPLLQISELCQLYNAHLIVDEAHATGVLGEKGEGLVQVLGLQKNCFARIHTFGKACGVHGAIVLGTESLRNFLINFSRPFIYTTALPEVSLAAIKMSYEIFPQLHNERKKLGQLISQFQMSDFKFQILKSETPIQAVIIPGVENVKKVARHLQDNQFDVRPILYPTVQKGKERLRIILHAFNTPDDVSRMVSCLQ